MKKLLSAALAAVMSISLFAACGTKTENTGNNASNDSKKVLTMATNAEFKPFEYIEGEEVIGADVDLANAIADKLGYKLEISNIDFDAALTGVATGKYDIGVAGITANEERKKNMDFTNDYFKASQAIIVAKDSAIKGASDLEGKTVSCQEGTTGEQYLNDNGYAVQSFKTASEAISALTAGKVDAVVIDDSVAKALSAEQNGATVVLDEPLTQETYAIALKKGNTELTDKINGALDELKADGTLKKIFEKYDLTIDAE